MACRLLKRFVNHSQDSPMRIGLMFTAASTIALISIAGATGYNASGSLGRTGGAVVVGPDSSDVVEWTIVTEPNTGEVRAQLRSSVAAVRPYFETVRLD